MDKVREAAERLLKEDGGIGAGTGTDYVDGGFAADDAVLVARAYLAAHPAPADDDAGRAVTGWRPIETCPKIGDVMLWFPRGGYRMELPPMCRVGNPVNYGYRKPTHWQPLPPPPTAAGDAEPGG